MKELYKQDKKVQLFSMLDLIANEIACVYELDKIFGKYADIT